MNLPSFFVNLHTLELKTLYQLYEQENHIQNQVLQIPDDVIMIIKIL